MSGDSLDLGLSDKYDPTVIEKKWREKWEDQKLYSWDNSKSREETFAVDTPPPTVSGSLHLGHIFSYTQTDLIVRYQRMRGKNIFYPMGWDDNGLPTERRVQNVFGVRCDLNLPYDPNWKARKDKSSKDPVENISRKNFIEVCSQLTKEDEEVFKNLFKKLGLSVDWNLEYATIDQWCRRVSQLSFLKLFENGEAYNVESPTLWDVTFQTAVAQAEVEDRDHPGFYHDLQFKVEGGGDFVISTTRPELLPACIAVVAHPDDERYQHLFGKYALTPLFYSKVPILPAEHADPEKGSGILMVCTFGDTMDIEWWKKSGLPLKQIIGMNGRMLSIEYGKGPFISEKPEIAQKNYEFLSGLTVSQAQKKIAEMLADPSLGWDGNNPALIGALRPTSRPVKFYEKGERPLEFISTRQWFVHLLKHKEDLLKQGEKIEWQPAHMKSRYLDWVKGLNQDWCISRQRYFGVPFPVWYSLDENGEVDYHRPLVAKLENLPVDPLVDVPPGFKEDQRGRPGGFIGEKDVMDTWATSSLTPQIVTHWEKDFKRFQSLFPMDLRPQSHEIIRTWAFYTIVKAYLHSSDGDQKAAKDIPWHQVAISGWILDPDRKKMSKSKGNVVTPEKFLDEYGGDAVRYWSARARLGVDTAFDENLFKIGKKLCNKIFNASKFVFNQVQHFVPNLFDQKELTDKIIQPLDRAWIHKMKDVVRRCTDAFEKNDYALSLQLAEDHFWFFCDHYLELVKVRSYSNPDIAKRHSANLTLDWSLYTFLRLFAPFFPYLTEEVWQARYGKFSEGSIHKGNWPTHSNKELPGIGIDWNQDEYEELLSLAKAILAEIRSFKTKNQKNLKWPVKNLEIITTKENMPKIEKILEDVLTAGNIEVNRHKLTEGEMFVEQPFIAKIELADSSGNS